MPAKTPLASDNACCVRDVICNEAAPFRPYCWGVVTRTRNVSEYMLVLALCPVIFLSCRWWNKNKSNPYQRSHRSLQQHFRRSWIFGSLLLTVSNLGLLFSRGAVNVYFSFLSLLNQSTAFIAEKEFFVKWQWSLACDLDLRTWPRYGKDEPACQIYRSKVICSIVVRRGTHTHTAPKTQPGSLK